MSGRTVLVTGATGFFGRHLVPQLLARGHRLRVVARRDIAKAEGLEVVQVGDIMQAIDWPRYLEGVDAVVHLAALAHATSIIREAEYDRLNRQLTARLAKATSATDARFVFMSSIAAQSGPSSNVVLTEDAPASPTTAYGRSKLRAEQEVAAATSRYVILRPTLTYGPGVIGNMGRIAQLATHPVPPPFGMMHNRRSLLSVENMCDAVEFALSSQAALSQVFLVSDPRPVTMAEIIAFLRQGAGRSGGGVPVPPMLFSNALRLLGRGELWEKIGGNLVVSVAKLEGLGFRWRINTCEGLRALGAVYAGKASRDVAATAPNRPATTSAAQPPKTKSLA